MYYVLQMSFTDFKSNLHCFQQSMYCLWVNRQALRSRLWIFSTSFPGLLVKIIRWSLALASMCTLLCFIVLKTNVWEKWPDTYMYLPFHSAHVTFLLWEYLLGERENGCVSQQVTSSLCLLCARIQLYTCNRNLWQPFDSVTILDHTSTMTDNMIVTVYDT